MTLTLPQIRDMLDEIASELDRLAHSPAHWENKSLLLCAKRDVKHAGFTLTFTEKKEAEGADA